MTKLPSNGLFACLALALSLSCASAYSAETLSDITAAAERFALAQVNDEKLSKIEAHAKKLDPRLGLTCENALETSSNSNSRNITRTTVRVSCNGVKPWSLYVPVTISAVANAVYTSRPLARGEELKLENLEIKQVPLQQLPANYFSDISQLDGMALSRSVNSGVILTLNTVKPSLMVERGQEVVILAAARGVEVRMTGIALKNGASGDLIPIRNINSGRTIEAIVLNDNTVKVNL